MTRCWEVVKTSSMMIGLSSLLRPQPLIQDVVVENESKASRGKAKNDNYERQTINTTQASEVVGN